MVQNDRVYIVKKGNSQVPAFWGTLARCVPLGPLSWFRVGGASDYAFYPSSVAGLQAFLQERPVPGPYMVLGAGSNLIVRDGGFRGCVIFLPNDCNMISRADGHDIYAGAKVLDKKIAKHACSEGIGGLEFLYTIPGTLGGGVRMNAGAFDGDIARVLVHAILMDMDGRVHKMTPKDLAFDYRRSALPEGWIVLGALLRGVPRASEDVLAIINEMSEKRRDTQPSGRTGGSTFKNPLPKKAWELIDQAGMRGAQVGGAVMSPKHCNFMINQGNATASDLETLGENVRDAVEKKSGVRLEWEIVRVGDSL